jgi:hypothetical protein
MSLFHIHIRDDRLAVEFQRAFHARGGRTGRREQRLNEPARILGIEADDFPPGDDLFRGFACMVDDKGGHRAAFESGGLLKDALVRARDPRHEPLGFRCFHELGWHGGNVCLCGTHFKN